MKSEEREIRTGFGVMTESAPMAPSFEEISAKSERSRVWRPGLSFAVLGLAVAVFVAMAVLDSGMRLAYAMDAGLELTYSVQGETTIGDETLPIGPATVAYRMIDAGNDLTHVVIAYEPLERCDDCFGPVTFTQTVTARGEIVAIDGLTEGSEIPEFVIPTPIPLAGIEGGFPLFLGPPLPQRALELGDTWGTDEDGLVGRHRLVEETQIGDRNVVLIESTYRFSRPEDGEETTAETRVWFDAADGIVVEAQIVRSQAWLDKTVEVRFRLSE